MSKLQNIGGQALIEGVLMRSKTHYSIAVRKPNKKIVTLIKKIKQPNKFWKIPFIRGIYNLFEMMVIGIKALNFSTKQQEEKEDEIKPWHLVLNIIFAIIFALVIFKLIPLAIAQFFSGLSDILKNNVLFNIIEGIFKIGIFILYVYLIGLFKDVKRVFQYHGAEHMTIACYEDKKSLTQKNIRQYPTMHVRCGTSFIVLVILISVFVYSFIFTDFFFLKYLYRILLLPIIAGISYEILKLSGKHTDNWFFKIISKPGLFIQKLTTAQPDPKQIEVAVKSLKTLIGNI